MVQNRRKVMSSRLCLAFRRRENSLCRVSSKWVPFSNQGKIRQRMERDELRLSSGGTLTPLPSPPPPPLPLRRNLYLSLPFLNRLISNASDSLTNLTYNPQSGNSCLIIPILSVSTFLNRGKIFKRINVLHINTVEGTAILTFY